MNKIFFSLLMAYAIKVQCETSFSIDEQTALVNAHNKWRIEVKSPPIIWSTDLANIAQEKANDLSLNKGCKTSDSETVGLGKNVYWTSYTKYWGSEVSTVKYLDADDVINSWASEKQYFDPKTNFCFETKDCEHYTQIVWKETKEIGCGKAICKDNSQIWVCSYKPEGNIDGKRPY